MDRCNYNQANVEAQRDVIRSLEVGYDTPCPGSRLKLDDDVLWLGFVYGRILWGSEDPASFYTYMPEFLGGEGYGVLTATYINDRAPADPNEAPLPIYPEEPVQQFAQQPGVKEHLGKKPKMNPNPSKEEVTAALTKLLQSLPKEARKNAREYIRKHRSDITLPED